MGRLLQIWRNFYDVRAGERRRTLFMGLYLALVLFSYYILKPVSRALFLDRYDIERLPYLTILVAFAGGILAYLQTRVAVRYSLQRAVSYGTLLSAISLVVLWWLLQIQFPKILYVFNVWLSLFSITLVSQGWLVAGNVFNPREAKRLYGILGAGAVVGAAFGGSFTALAAPEIGTKNLLLVSAVVLVLSYGAFRALLRLPGVSLEGAKATDEGEDLALADILQAIGRHRHLQVIIGIIIITYIVDVMIDFQFSAMAKSTFQGDELTAFLGGFFGLYLNLVTFTLQFFLTTFVTSRFGVGGTLQIMPFTIALASVASLVWPGSAASMGARLAEAATRYSFNRTGMELLYLPLPAELRNRTKVFVDIFTDRFARGLGGLLLLFLTVAWNMDPYYIAYVTLLLAFAWMGLSWRARKEYIATVRKRLDARRLDLESARISVTDPATVRLLEETVENGQPRQAAYALRLLGEVPQYRVELLLTRLVDHPAAMVRAVVYDLARARGVTNLLAAALAELRQARGSDASPALQPAACYALAHDPEARSLARRLLDHPNPVVGKATIEALADYPDVAQELLTHDWLTQATRAAHPHRRALAAVAVRIRGDEGTEALHRLLEDSDPYVLDEALRAAGTLRHRAYLHAIVGKLGNARLRGTAVEALAAFGDRVTGTLGDVLADESVPVAIRRQVPRVLQAIPHQRSVDLLLQALSLPDLSVRGTALRALVRLRDTAPQLEYGGDSLQRHILEEARCYYEINAALAPFRENIAAHTAAGLLARTLEDRLQDGIERLFRLMGLRYPPKEMQAAYLAVNRRRGEEFSTALEFLDSVLERELKRVLLPLLDDEGRVSQSGRELFGLENKDAATALRGLLRSDDAWLVSCAIAAAAELGLRELAPDIAALSHRAGTEVGRVAQSAVTALA